TLVAAGSVALGVGALALVNIVSSAPADPIWEEVRCWTGTSFQGDEKCFASRLSDGLEKMEAEHRRQKEAQEKAFEERRKELNETLKKKGEQIASLEAQRREIADE